MENVNSKNQPKVVDSEGYNVDKPQNQNLPKYNSTSAHRDGSGVPAVENLNQTEGLKKEQQGVKKDDFSAGAPKNDESLFGQNTKTDLGNGQRDEDEDQEERIIRQ